MSHYLAGTSLKARSARGATLLGTGTAVERLLRLARNMILVRILAPDDFGLMAIITVATTAFEAFTEVGVKQSVIQNDRGVDYDYLNAAWWMQVGRGLGLFLVGTLSAPWVSHFYSRPELANLLRVAFLAILFRALMSPRAYVLEKEFKFGRVVLLSQGSAAFSTIVTVALAFAVKSIWVLVIGFVLEFAVMCLLSHILVPFLPRFRINREYLSELTRFGRGMVGLPLLTLISMQLDVVVLGKMVSASQLGMYSMAVVLAEYPLSLFSKIINPILLPAFSEHQEDKRKLNDILCVVTLGTSIFGAPLVASMIVCATPILSVIYGSPYAAMAVAFGMICAGVFVRLQVTPISSLVLALGQPHIHRRCVGLRAIVLAVLLYPGIVLFGLPGAAACVLLANLIALCVQIIYIHKLIGLRLSHYLSCWLRGWPLAGMVLVSALLLRFARGGHTWTYVPAVGLTFLATWVAGAAYVVRFWENLASRKAGWRVLVSLK